MHKLMMALALAFLAPGCTRAGSLAGEHDSDRVTLTGALAEQVLPAGETNEIYARVRVAATSPEAVRRGPANVAVVIDTSGSMTGKPIEHARSAALAMVEALQDGDRLAIVVFHSTTEIVLPSTELDEDEREKAKEKVAAIVAQGTTDLTGGLQAGIDQVAAAFDDNGINRVVLLGDGVPNDASALHAMAEDAGRRQITITCFGLGEEYDESLMGAIAQRSGGRFHYVESPDGVVAFFKNEALRLESVFAKNAVLTLRPGPGVSIVDVVGQRSTRIGPAAEILLGDMSRDDAREIFVKITAPPHKSGAAIELVDAVLSFEDPRAEGKRVERRVYLGATASSARADIERGRDKPLAAAAARAVAAAKTVQAIEQARNGDVAGAKDNLERAEHDARKSAAELGDQDLARQAESMGSLNRDFKDEAPPAPAATPGAGVAPKPAHGREKAIRSAHDEAMQVLQN